MLSRAVTVSLKTGLSQADRDKEVVCVRMCGYKSPVCRVAMDPTHIRTVGLTKSASVRAHVVRGLSCAVSFCADQKIDLVVHAQLIHVTPRGVVIDIADAPDTRFEPPEGGYSPSWSIGCVLHKMITGRAPVTLLDVEIGEEMRALVRCLGAPTLSELLAFGVQAPDRQCRSTRRAVRGARFAERIVLRETLAWDPTRRMLCTAGGLVSATARIEEEDEADPA